MHVQGETHYPWFQESSTSTTGVTAQIFRPRDGAYIDFNDGVFKTTGWTNKTRALVEDANAEGMWRDSTGWVLPLAYDQYVVIAKATIGANTRSFVVEIIPATYVRLASVNDVGALTTAFVTTLTETETNHWDKAFIKFVSGTLAGQVQRITAYNGITKQVTVDAFSSAPSNGDVFKIINE